MQRKFEFHRPVAESSCEPVTGHYIVIDTGHPVVNRFHETVWTCGDDRKGIELASPYPDLSSSPTVQERQKADGVFS